MLTTRQQNLAWIAGFTAVLVLAFILRGVLAPFLAGGLMAWLLRPTAVKLEKRRLSKTWASAILSSCWLIGFIGLAALLLPIFVSEIGRAISQLQDWVQDGNLRGRSFLDFDWGSAVTAALGMSLSEAGSILSQANRWLLQPLLGGTGAVAKAVYFLFFAPLASFFLLRDWDAFARWFSEWMPRPWAEQAESFLAESRAVLLNWLYGVAIVVIVLSTIYMVVLLGLGVNYAVSVGLFAGLISFIPLVGAIFGLLVACGLAALQFGLGWQTWAVLVLFLAAQALESNVLTPKLVGGKVGIHPLIAIVALLAGGALLGLAGVLLAIPVVAILRLAVERVRRSWKESRLYSSGFSGLDL